MNEVKSKVLVVDDESGILNAIRRVLRRETFEVVVLQEPEEALQLLQHETFAALISDQRMPTMEGTYLLEQARQLTPDTVRILLTGYVDIQAAIEAINRGEVFRFVTKPWDDEKLRSTVRQAVSQFELMQDNRRLNVLTEKQNTELAQLNKELAAAHEQEVYNASRIQQGLLQSQVVPQLVGLETAVLSIPSQQIDGDFYDFFEHGGYCLDLVVGDVMGKGVPAAILGAATKNQLLRAMNQLLALGGALPSPEEIVSLAHRGVTRQLIDLESFVTVCYARFYLNQARLDFVDCGHTKPIHFSRHRTACTTLQGINMPLGVSAAERYEQVRVGLDVGDVLVFYSDGLTEAQSPSGELFGVERLMELVHRHSQASPAELVQVFQAAAVEHMGHEDFADDFTCIVCRVKERVAAKAMSGPRGRLAVASAPERIAQVRHFVRERCREAGLEGVDLLHIELAVGEAVSNIMRHAYAGAVDRELLVEIDDLPDAVAIRLYHWGNVFDPDSVAQPAFDGSREHGFGVYIIDQCMDDVEYSRDTQGRNCVSLVKKRG